VPGGQAGDTLAGFLKRKGLTDANINAISAGLPGVFELSFAFAGWAVPAEAITACGLNAAAAASDPNFNLLLALGLTPAQMDQLNTTICGSSTIEGAPHLKADHLSVFDCANKCGKLGSRFIHPHGHIRMMAAAQPFITGAISKTINLPNDATVADITECYRMSWELGLKANALYRDGCKLSQPLSSTADEAKKEAGQDETTKQAQSSSGKSDSAPAQPVAIAAAPTELMPVEPKRDLAPPPRRRRLPDTRRSLTHKFNIAGHEGYLTVGLYEDGLPGELFITMSKEGSTIGGLMDSLGTATSVALQYGVPVSSLVNKFSHQRFEPAGMTENSDIPFAKSLVDYIFRWMGMQFIEGYRAAHSPRAQQELAAQDEARWKDGDRPRITPPSTLADTSRQPATPAPNKPLIKTVSNAVSRVTVEETRETIMQSDVLSRAAADAQADAPACDVCGSITVRSGTCYKCLNCGNSMGCS